MKNFDFSGDTSNPSRLQDISLGLLANSGYSAQPRSFGQILAASFASADERRRQREEEQLAKAKLGLELQRAQRDKLGALPQGYMYNEATGQASRIPGLENYDPLQGQGGTVEWAYNQSKKDPSFTQFFNRYNYDKANASQEGRNASDLQYKPNIRQAEQLAEATGKAQVDLPTVITQAEQALKNIQDLKTSKGREYATGFSSVVPMIPGTEQANFITKLDQIKGQTFLQAYERLKGTGQITEVEGAKATDAIARLNRAQTQDEFLKSLNELEEIITKGIANAKNKAAGNFRQQQTPESIPTGASVVAPNSNMTSMSNINLKNMSNEQIQRLLDAK